MSKQNRIISLDLVRLFSCICVTLVHFNAQISGYNGTFVYENSITPNFFIEDRLYLGGIGVSLFFMLSGATLMLTYRKGNVWKYYKKKFLNIFPMFWLVYFVTTVVDFLLYKGISSGDLRMLLFSIVGMDGYLSAMGFISTGFYKIGEWFLGCLLCLYAIFPLLYLGIEKKPRLTYLCIAIVYIGYTLYVHAFNRASSGLEFFLKIPELLLGMLFIKYNMRDNLKQLLCITGSVGMVAFFLRNWISNATFCTAMCMVLFSILVCIGEQITKERTKNLLVKVAGLTYPVFLIHHWLILKLLRGFDLANIQKRNIYVMLVVFVIATLLLAEVADRGTKLVTKYINKYINS